MRELIIHTIKSHKYYLALVNMGEKTPILNLLSNEDLLQYYDFCMTQ